MIKNPLQPGNVFILWTCNGHGVLYHLYELISLGKVFRIYTVIFFLLSFPTLAQVNYEVSIHYYNDTTRTDKVFPDELIHIDSFYLSNTISQHLSKLYEAGYLAATSQLIVHTNKKANVIFFTNRLFTWTYLNQGNVGGELLRKLDFNPDRMVSKPFSYGRISNLMNSILDHAENHGYPFASVRLDSLSIVDGEISALLNYQSGPLINFDTLVVRGYDKVKSDFLMTHLGIYPGKPYEERLVQSIPQKLRLLPFITLSEPPIIIIADGKCRIDIHLDKKNVSAFDGVLGVLPNQKDGNGVLITGQLQLDLHNLFASGKRIAIDWQSYGAGSQLLNALYFHPNIFKAPLNFQPDFYLLKQDSTFIIRKLGIEISMLSRKNAQIGFRAEWINSNLISTYGLKDILVMPINSDYKLNYYGVDYQMNKFNDIVLPTRGFKFGFNASVGQKKIIKNLALNQDIYTGIKLQTIQFKIHTELEKYWKLNKNLLLRSKLEGAYLNGENLFQSDVFRLGGLRSLRGFVENEFYTPAYATGTLEFRAMLSRESYFLLFWDQGVISNFNDSAQKIQYPFGTGAGFTFSTDAGLFNLVFALGKSTTQPFAFNYSKIHFGYISRF